MKLVQLTIFAFLYQNQVQYFKNLDAMSYNKLLRTFFYIGLNLFPEAEAPHAYLSYVI